MQALFELELVVRDEIITSANGKCRGRRTGLGSRPSRLATEQRKKRKYSLCHICTRTLSPPSQILIQVQMRVLLSECLMLGTMSRRDCECDPDAESPSGR